VLKINFPAFAFIIPAVLPRAISRSTIAPHRFGYGFLLFPYVLLRNIPIRPFYAKKHPASIPCGANGMVYISISAKAHFFWSAMPAEISSCNMPAGKQ
jgi:hypothetical protein